MGTPRGRCSVNDQLPDARVPGKPLLETSPEWCPGASSSLAQAFCPGGQAALVSTLQVQQALHILQGLALGQPLPTAALQQALLGFDSRAVALLLKDLNRSGLGQRAAQLFDWLRSLPGAHPLAALCDVYTWTAMVSLCMHQQDAARAQGLVEDMRARGTAPNVHTYTALMNVCIKCGRLEAALETYQRMRQEGCTPNVGEWLSAAPRPEGTPWPPLSCQRVRQEGAAPTSRVAEVPEVADAPAPLPLLVAVSACVVVCGLLSGDDLFACGLHSQGQTDAASRLAFVRFGGIPSVTGQAATWGLRRGPPKLSRALGLDLSGAWGGGREAGRLRWCCLLSWRSPLPAVTYNTLIDVHGKMGRWEQALQVVATMKQEVGVSSQMLVSRLAAHDRACVDVTQCAGSRLSDGGRFKAEV